MRVHTCKVAIDAVERNGYELIPSCLFANDFFLFQNLKRDICGCYFQSDKDVKTAVQEWVNGKDLTFSVLS